MDKARIYGVYEFIGFHLCKRFLEKGLILEGIYMDSKLDIYMDEKKLEIGRNANFEEITLEDLYGKKEVKEEAELTIISLYDWWMNDYETKSIYLQLFPQIIEAEKQTKSKLVVLLPIQFLTDLRDQFGMNLINNLLTQIDELKDRVQYFYLPTIFGPWQPSSFLFQRKLLQEQLSIGELDIREWPFDAIFIDDALATIVERIESGDPGSFLLESGVPDSWEQCAKILDVSSSIYRTIDHASINSQEEIERLVIQKVTPYEKALFAQKEHLSFLFDIRDDL